MSFIEDDKEVMTKVRELCVTITGDKDFQQMYKNVEKFLNDEEATGHYRSVHALGEELHNKKHAGLAPAEGEIQAFESAKEKLWANPIARDFLDAQHALETLQATVGNYVGKTLQLGRVPTSEDFESSGCCGGGGDDEGGCGCQH